MKSGKGPARFSYLTACHSDHERVRHQQSSFGFFDEGHRGHGDGNLVIWKDRHVTTANWAAAEPELRRCAYLGIPAEDFGVETDPVVRDEHFPLI